MLTDPRSTGSIISMMKTYTRSSNHFLGLNDITKLHKPDPVFSVYTAGNCYISSSVSWVITSIC